MDFRNIDWNKERDDFILFLKSVSEEQYQEFTKQITPGDFTLLGVRTPVLHGIARNILKGDYHTFLEVDDDNIFEIKMLKAFVIAGIKKLDEYMDYFNMIIPTIDNWNMCDGFLSSSKIIGKNKEHFYEVAVNLLKKEDEFLNRVSFVMLLDYFVDDDYYKEILELVRGYRSEHYYSNMGLAWLISVIYIKYPEETQKYLLTKPFDETVSRYIIRKVRDSYRVSDNDKEWLKKHQIF